MAIRVAIIGAGGVQFTRKTVRDILAIPECADATFAFTDIHRPNLGRVARLCRRDIAAAGLPARIEECPERRAALAGADYVFSVVRVGGLEAFRADIEIPLTYGVDQCVGDTLCVGGIMYGQRNIPVILDFCRDIKRYARPGALFLNHANPMAINCWAAAAHGGGVPVVGLCHGVQHGHWQIAEVIKLLVNGARKPGARGYREVRPSDVDIVCAGINHQTWYLQVRFDGADWTARLLEGFRRHPGFARQERVRIDMLERFGYYSTESNGHLSEYVPWYRKHPRETRRWINLEQWIHGETGGYLRVCTEERDKFEREYPALMQAPPLPIGAAHRSAEHGSYIIEALETGRVYRGHFNVVNRGCIANLPDDCIIEAPGYVDRNGLAVPRVGALPSACAAVCQASVNVQRLAVEAAVTGDVMRLKQAALLDPLTGAVCAPDEIDRLVDEMLVAQARWLPQFAAAIPDARRRLRRAPRAKPRATRGTRP